MTAGLPGLPSPAVAPPPGGRRWPVAVLGATGAVGQTFIRLLAAHPWFELVEVAASERSAGKRYAEAARWLEGTMPTPVAGLTVKACDPSAVKAPLVFSALDAGVAGAVEEAFAHAGRVVLSNAKNFRMEQDVPLLIPEVNAAHLAVLGRQRAARGWTGAIVTNANCAATVAALALAPLHEAFGLTRLFAMTMQAVSGAGYPGVPSLDILGNVIPFIGEEEPKIERELPKLLGGMEGDRIVPATFGVSTHTNRVPVEHGHTVCMSMEFARRPSLGEAREAFVAWRGAAEVQGLPSAPEPPVLVVPEENRPQPRRDVNAWNGMQVLVGRLREDPQLHLRCVALGHNTVRGAAGGSVLNAELMAARGLLPAA
jgi:aspartate-semialdehyde dehydrogenase